MKKALALVLCLCLAFAMLPVVAFAAENEALVEDPVVKPTAGDPFVFFDGMNAADWNATADQLATIQANGSISHANGSSSVVGNESWFTHKNTFDSLDYFEFTGKFANTNKDGFVAVSVGDLTVMFALDKTAEGTVVNITNDGHLYLIVKMGDEVIYTLADGSWGTSTNMWILQKLDRFKVVYDNGKLTATYIRSDNGNTGKIVTNLDLTALDGWDSSYTTLNQTVKLGVYCWYQKQWTTFSKLSLTGITPVYSEPEVCTHENTEVVTENAVDADCDTAGSYDEVVKCADCGEELSRETITVDALGHTEVDDDPVDATLDSTGLTAGKHCSVCGEVLVAQQVIPMLKGEATVNGKNYATLEEAYAAAKDGDVITVNSDVTIEDILVIDKAITLDGNGHTLTYTGKGASARAINVDCAGDVAIIDIVVDAANAERAINVINKAGNLTLTEVTAVASHYPVNVAATAAGATVTINDSDLTGLNVVNIRANNVTVEINDSKLTVIDESNTESYAAIFVGKEVVDGSVAMNGGEVVLGGDSSAASYWSNVEVTFTDVIGADKVATVVATIGAAGYTTLEDAIAAAKDGETIVLLRDITLTESVRIAKKVTIDLNGKTITANFEDSYGAFYVAMAGDLTIVGEGAIDSSYIAIGVYGKLTVNGGTISGDYAAIYNFYYNASTYGTTTIDGATVEGWVLNCGELAVENGSVQWIDNSGALAVNGGAVEYIYGRDGSDAAGVEGAGTIAIADPSAIEVPEGYVLLEVEGVYVVHAHSYTTDVTAPDCVNGGYTTYTCDCGDSYVADYTDALGHTWGEWEITTEATAAVPGVKTRTCGTCGATETEEYVLDNAGVTGEVTWRFEDGTIYIEGNGAMDDYLNQGHTVPWADYRTQTTAVVIGDGVTHVGNRAFRGFNRIITVTFGNDVETMGYEAFYLCNKITTVTLNEGLTNIGSYAFYGCTALEQIEIPSTVATLDNRCFKGAGLTSIVVPNTVTYTGYEVFMNCANLETVEYSTGVQYINSRVFENCTSLKSFYVASNIQRIRTSAFYGCTALESVTFEDANNMWATPDGSSAKIASNTFEGCNSSLKLIADEGTHVESYAARHGFVFEAK